MYTQEMQSYMDIDWFAVDINGIIVNFASGGGQLPKSIASSKELTEKVFSYFDNLSYKEQNIFINDDLSQMKEFSSEEVRLKYLQSYVSMSKKGVYSFDKTILGNFDDEQYHLVCFPEACLKLDELPLDIQEILKQTRIDKDITKVNKLLICDIS